MTDERDLDESLCEANSAVTETRWRRRDPSAARRIAELEAENARFRSSIALLAEAEVENARLREQLAASRKPLSPETFDRILRSCIAR